MASYNRVTMMGNLTRDPEFKQLPSGQAVCRLGLACNRQFKNRQTGDMVQEVCFVDIDVWGAQAENCHQYLQKGRSVLIEGRLKYDVWQDGEGKNRSKHSIVADRVVFLSSGLQADVEVGSEDSVGGGRVDNELSADVSMTGALNKQINEVKARTQSKVDLAPVSKAKKQQPSSNFGDQAAGTAPFTDQPPFQDDLPF